MAALSLVVSTTLAVFLSGCLCKINRIYCASSVTVGEEFSVSVWGRVSGDHGGIGGIVVQVPMSVRFHRAVLIADAGRKTLRRNAEIEERYHPEQGHYVIAVVDSVNYVRATEADLQIILTFTADSVGSFLMKTIAGGAEAQRGIEGWRSTDPMKTFSFARLVDERCKAAFVVVEQNSNGSYAISFDGRKAFVATPIGDYLAGDSSYTLEWWMQTTTGGSVIVSTRRDDVRFPFPIEIAITENGYLQVSSFGSQSVTKTEPSVYVIDGKWHHVAIVYSKPESRVGVVFDGNLVDSIIAGSRSRYQGNDVTIGSRGGRNLFYRGLIDELRLWKEARSVAELVYYKDVKAIGYEEDLVVLYDFDTYQRASFVNRASPGQRDASAMNFPKLVYSSSPLRVETSTFRAEMEDDSVTLLWDAEESGRIARYEIEKRSEAGKYFSFRTIGAATDGQSEGIYRARDIRARESVSFYLLKVVDTSGAMRIRGELAIGLEEAHSFSLDGNQPNPCSQRTAIEYRLFEPSRVTLTVYNGLAQRIATLVNQKQDAGEHAVDFPVNDLPSGVYFYKLRTPSGSQTKKMIVMHDEP